MSSISIGELRRRGTVQTKIRGIIDALARQHANSIDITNPDFVPVTRSVDNMLTIMEESVFSRRKPLTRPFKAPIEPDGNFLVFWDKAEGNPARPNDSSCYGNKTKLYGTALPCIGIDTGSGGSYYTNYDGLTTRKITEDSPHVKLITKREISFQFRLYPKLIGHTAGSDSINGYRFMTILAKSDNEDYGYRIFQTHIGELVAHFRYAGVNYTISTPSHTIFSLHDPENRPYSFDCQIWADFVNKKFSIMVENAEYFDVMAHYANLGLPNPSLDTNLHHGHLQSVTKNPEGTQSYFFYKGGIQDVRIWKRKLTPQEMLNYHRNKLTIADAQLGFVGMVGEVIVAESQLGAGIYSEGIYPEGMILG